MKKRSMKKWIPKGIYCHGPLTKIIKITSDKKEKILCVYDNYCPWARTIDSSNNYTLWCKYTKEEIMDCVKNCGVKED